MKPPRWVGRDTVLALHERLIERYGGAVGLRDAGLLDSALARPENLAAYETPDLFALAAAYASGICRNHPFVDGNKRTGFTTAGVFLEYNGLRLQAPEAEAVVIMVALANRQLSEGEFAAWLRLNCKRRRRK